MTRYRIWGVTYYDHATNEGDELREGGEVEATSEEEALRLYYERTPKDYWWDLESVYADPVAGPPAA